MTSQEQPILARKVVVDANLSVFLQEVADAVRDGWSIDPVNPGNIYGYLYEVHLLKDESLIDTKPTRADIAAGARSAKAKKAAEQAATAQSEQVEQTA